MSRRCYRARHFFTYAHFFDDTFIFWHPGKIVSCAGIVSRPETSAGPHLLRNAEMVGNTKEGRDYDKSQTSLVAVLFLFGLPTVSRFFQHCLIITTSSSASSLYLCMSLFVLPIFYFSRSLRKKRKNVELPFLTKVPKMCK